MALIPLTMAVILVAGALAVIALPDSLSGLSVPIGCAAGALALLVALVVYNP